MKYQKLACLVIGIILLSVSPVLAKEHGTREEAQALAEKAAALMKSEPAEKAFAAFQDKNGEFIDKDLYVFVVDKDGKFAAHGAKPVLVGRSAEAMKDVTGNAFGQAFMNVKDTAWVDYKWPDPMDENKIKDKSTYCIRVGDYVLGVGYYK